MFVTFLIMVAIELSLFVDKRSALIFAGSVLLVGLLLRGLAAEFSSRQKAALAAATPPPVLAPAAPMKFNMEKVDGAPIMCAVRGLGRTLDYAIGEAKETRRPLYLLFVRTLPVLTEQDYKKKWQDDEQAREVFLAAKSKANGHPVFPCYAVSDSVADTIVDIAATMGASSLILGAPERKGLAFLLRGNIIRDISDNLPDEIHLLVYA
jgi:nucleotide-binding universal stress UspA family protein